MNHEQFPMQMTQNSKHNKWLEMLAGKDFPPKLLWRERQLKFIGSGKDDDNKKPRSRETIA